MWRVSKSSKIKHPGGSGGFCPLDQTETHARYPFVRIFYFCQITPQLYNIIGCRYKSINKCFDLRIIERLINRVQAVNTTLTITRTKLTRQAEHQIPTPRLVSGVTALLDRLALPAPLHCIRLGCALCCLLLPHEDTVQGKEIDGGNLDQLLGGQRLLGQVAAEVFLEFLFDGRCNLKI